MFFDHGSKALERFHSAPFQRSDPFPEKLDGPCPGFVLPEMAEGLLEKMCLEEPGTHEKEFLQGFSALALQVGSPGQEHELLAGQHSFHPVSQPLELLLPNVIDRLEEVPDHMELVENHLGVGTMGPKALPKERPHIHDAVSDETGPILPEPLPEGAGGSSLCVPPQCSGVPVPEAPPGR